MVYLDEKKLKPLWTVEIKWSNLFFDNPNDLKSLISFCKNNNIKNTLCTTIDKEGYKDCSGIKIQFIPASLYAYIVGNNTLEKKKNR